MAAAIPRPRTGRLCALLGVALAVITIWVYLPVGHHDFVAYDDGEYVTDNDVVQRGLTLAGVKWAFTTGHASNWHPLTWISHMVDVELFGSGPAGPHLVNVAIHFANALLAFAVLVRLTGGVWRSAFVAAAFAIHPAHVESVAWVAERKDVLSAFFFLLTLWAYARYVRERTEMRSGTPNTCHPERSEGSNTAHASGHPDGYFALLRMTGGRAPNDKARKALGWYLVALLFFALGLMCKPMLVTLPCVLLLLDYWPLGRFSILPNSQRVESSAVNAASPPAVCALLWEKLPFFVLSIVSSIVTFAVQNEGGTVRSFAAFSFGHRAENAVVSYTRYLGELFWPVDLTFFYPSVSHLPAWQIASSLAAMVVLTSGAIWFGRRRPYWPVGWLWFCGMLVPVIGLVQVGDQSLADRYTYLPALGVFIAIAWGAGEFVVRWPQARGAAIAAGVAALVVCGVRARAQVRYWQNTEALCEHALAVTGENFVAYNSLASDRFRRGQLDAAIGYYERALALRPDFAVGHHNLGIALWQIGQAQAAIAHLARVAALQPQSANAQNNFGWILRLNGRLDEAIVALQRALTLRPNYAEAHNNLGKALALNRDFHGAIVHYEAALQLQPNNTRALINLAWVRATAPDAALRDGTRALALAERARALSRDLDGELLETLAAAYAEVGRFEEAIKTSESALGWARAESTVDVVTRLEAQLSHYRAGVPTRDDRSGAEAASAPSPAAAQSKTSFNAGSTIKCGAGRYARLCGGRRFGIACAREAIVRLRSNPSLEISC